MADSERQIIVLGIGNVLWADEGFGVRCLETLQRHFDISPEVSLIDGGTQGLYLIQHVQAATHLLILDAIDYGLEPGTLRTVDDDEVPAFLGARKMSLHQTGFQEVLMLARLTGHYPQAMRLIGCQPQELDDYGGSLRPVVRAALDRAVLQAVQTLRDWGAGVTPRSEPLPPVATATGAELDMQSYERGRPSPLAACREGDPRFLVSPPTEGAPAQSAGSH